MQLLVQSKPEKSLSPSPREGHHFRLLPDSASQGTIANFVWLITVTLEIFGVFSDRNTGILPAAAGGSSLAGQREKAQHDGR
eukprot:1254995-Rhodomonas_salina.1